MHQSACRVVNKREWCALLGAVLKPRVFRAVNLHQLAKAIAPAAWLMRGRQTMAAVDPQSRRDACILASRRSRHGETDPDRLRPRVDCRPESCLATRRADRSRLPADFHRADVGCR